ncbi:60S ribosomal protein L3-1 [Bienertia sinuspersici]
MIDSIGITKGKVYEGVVTRWGVTRFPRKTTEWLPSPYRDEQDNIQARNEECHRVMTKYDRIEKDITPIGGFPRYDVVKEIKLKFIDTSSKLTGPWSIPEHE